MPSVPKGPEPVDAARWCGVSVRYPYARRDAVGPVTLRLRAGERLLLLGPSGAGKSTLLDTVTDLIPQVVPATVVGEVLALGAPSASQTPAHWAGRIARHFQDADQTLCGMRVEDEIAFALENKGLGADAILSAVASAMADVGLPAEWRARRTTTLSGGERQLVALAATLAQQATVLLVDEPTSHLAPAATNRLHHLLMNRLPGQSVLIVDHRLDGLIGTIDRVAVLGNEGTIIAEGAPATLFRQHGRQLQEIGVWRPLASRIDQILLSEGIASLVPPTMMGEVMAHLDGLEATGRALARTALQPLLLQAMPATPRAEEQQVVARLVEADCAPFLGPVVLRKVTVEVRSGTILGVLGANGAGKSTLGLSLAGLLRLKGGKREGVAGGVAFQNPENQFVTGTARDEVITAFDTSIAATERITIADRVLAEWGLADVAHQHPFELSHGQKRRLALASLTANERWPLLVLDEPMAGLDAAATANLIDQIERLAKRGKAIVLITHDMDLALRLCQRSVIVGDGGIVAEGQTAELLADAALLARAGLAVPLIMPLLDWIKGGNP